MTKNEEDSGPHCLQCGQRIADIAIIEKLRMKLLPALWASNHKVRWGAIMYLVSLGITEEIAVELQLLAENDPDETVRLAARSALGTHE